MSVGVGSVDSAVSSGGGGATFFGLAGAATTGIGADDGVATGAVGGAASLGSAWAAGTPAGTGIGAGIGIAAGSSAAAGAGVAGESGTYWASAVVAAQTSANPVSPPANRRRNAIATDLATSRFLATGWLLNRDEGQFAAGGTDRPSGRQGLTRRRRAKSRATRAPFFGAAVCFQGVAMQFCVAWRQGAPPRPDRGRPGGARRPRFASSRRTRPRAPTLAMRRRRRSLPARRRNLRPGAHARRQEDRVRPEAAAGMTSLK